MSNMKPFGSDYKFICKSWHSKFIFSVWGYPELHTHYRTRALLKAYDIIGKAVAGKLSILEVGCGIGLNLLEARNFFEIKQTLGFDADSNAIATAKAAVSRLSLRTYNFITKCELPYEIGFSPDVVLLIDVLEHIEAEPRRMLIKKIASILPKNAFVCVSVPTIMYPSTFGDHMHKHIGHVMDGYTLSTLDAEMGPSFSREFHKLSTGGLQARLCNLYYSQRLSAPTVFNGRVKTLLFLAGKILPTQSSEKTACSLFVLYRKMM